MPSKQLITKIQKQLEAEKIRIEKELNVFTKKNTNVVGEYDASFPEYGDDMDENAREIAEYATNKPLEVALEKTLRDVNKALASIAKGTYGICKYCDKTIDEKRLVARPTSSSCVSCKKTLTDEV